MNIVYLIMIGVILLNILSFWLGYWLKGKLNNGSITRQGDDLTLINEIKRQQDKK